MGALSIDTGALKALNAGKSLLPAGVTRLSGRFDEGDTVSILAADGTEVARGICAYSDADVARIMGHKSAQIEGILGYRSSNQVIQSAVAMAD